MNLATRSTAALVTVGLAVLVLLPGTSTAAPATPTADTASPKAFSLAISPTRLVVSPDDIGSVQQITVINGGTAPMPITVQKQDFTSDNHGTLLFGKQAPYSASNWVTLSPTSFVVPAGGTTIVSARIAVPSSPEPGDHHLALVFLAPAGRSAANVRINRGIGMPVFVTVPGPTDDSAEVTNLGATGFSMGGSVPIKASIHDSGTVHRDFRNPAPLTVGVGGHGTAAPFADFTVMRGGTRDIETTWTPPLMCICHVKVAVTNADGTESSKSVRVIVFPLLQVAIVLIALLILVMLYRLGRRRYRASVIRAAAALGPEEGARHL